MPINYDTLKGQLEADEEGQFALAKVLEYAKRPDTGNGGLNVDFGNNIPDGTATMLIDRIAAIPPTNDRTAAVALIQSIVLVGPERNKINNDNLMDENQWQQLRVMVCIAKALKELNASAELKDLLLNVIVHANNCQNIATQLAGANYAAIKGVMDTLVKNIASLARNGSQVTDFKNAFQVVTNGFRLLTAAPNLTHIGNEQAAVDNLMIAARNVQRKKAFRGAGLSLTNPVNAFAELMLNSADAGFSVAGLFRTRDSYNLYELTDFMNGLVARLAAQPNVDWQTVLEQRNDPGHHFKNAFAALMTMNNTPYGIQAFFNANPPTNENKFKAAVTEIKNNPNLLKPGHRNYLTFISIPAVKKQPELLEIFKLPIVMRHLFTKWQAGLPELRELKDLIARLNTTLANPANAGDTAADMASKIAIEIFGSPGPHTAIADEIRNKLAAGTNLITLKKEANYTLLKQDLMNAGQAYLVTLLEGKEGAIPFANRDVADRATIVQNLIQDLEAALIIPVNNTVLVSPDRDAAITAIKNHLMALSDRGVAPDTLLSVDDWNKLKVSLFIVKAFKELEVDASLKALLTKVLLVAPNFANIANQIITDSAGYDQIKGIIKDVVEKVAFITRGQDPGTINNFRTALETAAFVDLSRGGATFKLFATGYHPDVTPLPRPDIDTMILDTRRVLRQQDYTEKHLVGTAFAELMLNTSPDLSARGLKINYGYKLYKSNEFINALVSRLAERACDNWQALLLQVGDPGDYFKRAFGELLDNVTGADAYMNGFFTATPDGTNLRKFNDALQYIKINLLTPQHKNYLTFINQPEIKRQPLLLAILKLKAVSDNIFVNVSWGGATPPANLIADLNAILVDPTYGTTTQMAAALVTKLYNPAGQVESNKS